MYAPDVPLTEPPEQIPEMVKDMLETVTNMMQSFYKRHRVEQSQMAAFQEFSQAVLKTPMFELANTLTYKSDDIEAAGTHAKPSVGQVV